MTANATDIAASIIVAANLITEHANIITDAAKLISAFPAPSEADIKAAAQKCHDKVDAMFQTIHDHFAKQAAK